MCGDADRTCATGRAQDLHRRSVDSALIRVLLGLVDDEPRQPIVRRGAPAGGGLASARWAGAAGSGDDAPPRRPPHPQDGDGAATARCGDRRGSAQQRRNGPRVVTIGICLLFAAPAPPMQRQARMPRASCNSPWTAMSCASRVCRHGCAFHPRDDHRFKDVL